MNERAHDFDYVMDYCVRCGVARQEAVESQGFKCAATENVVAISHIIRGRRLGIAIGVTYAPAT